MLEKIDLVKKLDKKTYKRIMPELSERLYHAQKASWDAGIPVVILLEGWNAAGKGAVIRKLTSSLDPRGFKVYPIRAARAYEKKRPWLWRFWAKLPERGEWAIFDRSWYGRVVGDRVAESVPESEWRRGYRDIVDFERTIADDGYLMIKLFLHISKQEQRRRFDKLSSDPLSALHVTAEEWEHHRRYDDWVLAYEEAFERTDTEWGPWTIVEATNRRFTWVKTYQTIIESLLERLGQTFEVQPPVEAQKLPVEEMVDEIPSQEGEAGLQEETTLPVQDVAIPTGTLTNLELESASLTAETNPGEVTAEDEPAAESLPEAAEAEVEESESIGLVSAEDEVQSATDESSV